MEEQIYPANMRHLLYGKDIIQILQKQINEWTAEHWKSDPCPPVFTVSLDNEDLHNQKIFLTVQHLGESFTYTLFPRTDAMWGYGDVLELMNDMYNQTM